MRKSRSRSSSVSCREGSAAFSGKDGERKRKKSQTCSKEMMLENDSSDEILESLVGMESGKIIKLDPKAKYGFIGTGKDCKKYVHFKFCTVVNASGKPLSLAVEMPVHFKLGEWNQDARNQSAARVIIGPKDAMATLETMKGSNQHSKLAKLKTSSDGRNKRKDYNSNMSSKTWSIGKVCPFNPNQQHVFLKVVGQTMDVFMHKDKVSRFALELEPGDQIEFIVAEETKGNRKPNALKARFYSFKERPNSELALYLEELDSDILSSPNGQLAALELVPIQSLWERLSAGGANFDESYGLLLIRVVSQLLKKCKSHSSVALPMVETVLESRVMLELLIQDQGLDCTLWEFLKEAVVALPQIAMKIFLRVKQASRTQSASNHEQLLEFTEKACMRLNNMMGGGNDTKDWRILGPVLSDKEIFSSTPCSNDENLQKIKTDGGYSSADQYSETYYRLFRAETLALIQEAISDYRTLTSTNHKPKSQSTLSIFQNVKLVGYEIDRSVSVILQFNQIGAGVRDWARTRRLMFGNLMCLSPDQEFRGENLIWATVSNRDEDLLKKNCIALELFQEFNTLSIAAIISLLLTCEGRTVMIESPTYFHPMGCVLQTFKDMDVESFQLVEQIVYAKSDTNGVTYLRQRSKTIAKLCDQLNLPLSRHENTFISEKKDTIEMSVEKEVVTALNKLEMNKSQLKAFLHAMTNPLTIIQGPPGCGKTFIGLMLAKVILKCELPTPVLVLTYKNHALDEFLKGMIKCGACGAGDIVRVGGGSQDPAMEDCNLTKLAREESHGRALNDRYYDLKREVTHLTEEFKVVSEELNRKSFLTLQMLISQLNTEQLVHLVCKAKWCNRAGGNLVHKVNKSSYVDKQWILGTALPFVDKHFGGIKPFADLCCSESTCLPVLDDRKGDAAFKTMCEHVRDVIWKATNIWLPDRTLMKKLQQLQEKFSLNCQSVPANEADKKTMVNKLANNEEELDDDEMEELFRDRITSRKPSISGVRVRLNDIKESEIVFKHNDLPKNVAVPDITLLSQETLWDFDDINRFKFLHALISNQRDKVHQRFDEVLSQLNETLAHLKALKTNKNMVTARKRKVIGMTITGASLYSDLMQIVKPSVVIVEEAAEILETSLFAALNKDVEHLILIGDHKQLRPGVESYELVKHYSFDISMMERLIKCGFPYKSLDTQGRMRPEFSALLKDIYPNLKDNLALVRANKPLDCLQHSMYFWTHNHIESGMVPNDAEESKSKYNKDEAQMVVALVKFLIHSGVKKNKITVLAAYLRQKKAIKEMLNISSGPAAEDDVQVNTIDKYQGDENDYVIVSLVRSNSSGTVGFMGTLNRRCVAQSRAKAGLYFVGNDLTFQEAKKGTWKFLLTEMREQDLVGPKIPLQCPRHKSSSRKHVATHQEILNVISGYEQICSYRCGELSHCQQKEHPCEKPCVPSHQHNKCMKFVSDTFPVCGHSTQRRCFESMDNLRCTVDVTYSRGCGHSGKRKCYNNLIPPCPQPCISKMTCGHDCQQKCGSEHNHSVVSCKETVRFTFSSCKHEDKKMCCQKESELRCRAEVTKPHPLCLHQVKKMCSESFEKITCKSKCVKKMRPCLHDCPLECGAIHQHDTSACKVKINYKFPDCLHSSPIKKYCGEVITWLCKSEVIEMCQKGHHKIMRKCHDKNFSCPELCPPGTLRKCGHPSSSRCGEDPNKGSCKGCQIIFEAKNKEFRKAAAQRANEIEKAIKNKETEIYWRVELKKYGASQNEYMTVTDKVMKWIQPMHGWAPAITRIEKVYNKKLELKFERAKANMFGDLIDLKFHGTGPEGVEGIPKTGFRLPDKAGMYGKGIYFATDSSKSAQKIYTKGSNTLLLCEVLLGRSKTTEKADPSLNAEDLKKECYDSVFAPRGTAVQNDEYVVFNPDQAMVKYIIQYRTSSGGVAIVPSPVGALPSRKKIHPQRIWKDRVDEAHWNAASSAFYRNAASTEYEIDFIEVLQDPAKEANFLQKKNFFKGKGYPDGEITGFHGTDPKNIDSIIRNNLDPNRAAINGRVYGNGCYFSEFPDFSLRYGKGLLLFRILPGRESINGSQSGNFDTLKVGANNEGYGQQLVINDSSQFLPLYVYHISAKR